MAVLPVATATVVSRSKGQVEAIRRQRQGVEVTALRPLDVAAAGRSARAT